MVGRKLRKSRKKVMGNHQRCWLWGRHLVLETLRASRWTPLEVRISDRLGDDERREVEQLAGEDNIPVALEPNDRLSQLCRATDHQGYLARMPPFPYSQPDELFVDRPHPPVLLLLAGLQDPHNFGAIVRSADIFGVDAVVVGSVGQADVTATVARSSAGAVNYVPIIKVTDLSLLLIQCQAAGLAIVGTDASTSQTVETFDFTQATVIVIGNESAGIQAELRERCDALVAIPQCGHVGSLNAAVAAGILCYEVHRQRAQL